MTTSISFYVPFKMKWGHDKFFLKVLLAHAATVMEVYMNMMWEHGLHTASYATGLLGQWFSTCSDLWTIKTTLNLPRTSTLYHIVQYKSNYC
jgi:hypothetical protein